MLFWRQDVRPFPEWTTEDIFFSASQWFAGLLKDIRCATQSICIQTYIFELDTVGRPLLQALCEAASRGVAVRVIVDGIGSPKASTLLCDELNRCGAQLHIYHPLPWDWVSNRLEQGNWVSRFLRRVLHINQRQHSKLCLIDEQCAWVGSYNMTDVHLENHGKQGDWKDCGARVTGDRCALLQEFFEAVWFDDIKKLSPAFLYHPVTNFSFLLRKRRLRMLLQNIHLAAQKVWIVSAYFSPVQPLVSALKKAARRGVDVRVMVPLRSDVTFFPALSSTYYMDLLRAGVKIYEYEKGVLHAKLMMTDSAVLIGSSNMNHRSMLHDIELDISLYSDKSRDCVTSDFLSSTRHCRRVTKGNIGRLYAAILVVGQIPRLLRYWL